MHVKQFKDYQARSFQNNRMYEMKYTPFLNEIVSNTKCSDYHCTTQKTKFQFAEEAEDYYISVYLWCTSK